MKPVRLKIKGLNSFVEEQVIDFEVLTKQGFFGIFGPTGSGKSTILDGMILALYGMKAMSRGTNEFVNKNCPSAHISYEFQVSGTTVHRYRVEREFKSGAAGTKAGKCKLLEVTDEEIILEDTIKNVDRACADIIGLNADDFMRTVVLPQGKFSEFLQVSGKDRREILERLFRLEEYGRGLEERITASLKEEQAKKENLKGQMEAYGLANPQLLEVREAEQAEGKIKLSAMEESYQEKITVCAESESIWKLQLELAVYDENVKKLLVGMDSVEEKKRILKSAERAKGILPMLKSYLELEEQVILSKEKLELLEIEDKKYEENLSKAAAKYEEAKKNREMKETGIRLKLQEIKGLMEEWRAIPDLEGEQSKLEKVLTKKNLEITDLEARQIKLEKEDEKRINVISGLEDELKTSKISNDFRDLIDEGIQRKAAIINMEESLRILEKKLEPCSVQIKKEAAEIDIREKQMIFEEEELSDLQNELKVIKKDADKIQLERFRRELSDGIPCPVCGSLHHERKNGQSQAEEKENELEHTLLKSEELERKVKEKEDIVQNFRILNSRRSEVLKMLRYQEADQLIEKNKLLETYQEVLKEQQKLSLRVAVEDFNKEKIRIGKIEKKREEQEKSLSLLREESRLGSIHQTDLRLKIVMAKEEEAALKMKLLPLKDKIKEKIVQMEERIGKGNQPELYAEQLKVSLDKLLTDYDLCNQSLEMNMTKKQEISMELSQLKGQMKGSKEALKKSGEGLEAEISSLGFNDMNEVKKSALENETYIKLENEIEKFYDDLKENTMKGNASKEKLNGRTTTVEELEQFRKECKVLEGELNRQKEGLGELKQQIKNMKKNLEKQKKLTIELEKIDHRISILEDLKSVTRGKRFVEFMAAERLKYISKSASKRLKEITNGNYELETNGEGEFVIRDNKNGGSLRAPSTLSGGETFVTSLALALALSSEIQLKGTAPLELFFLDEGFGSLDENLLDVVMTSLERIHNEHLKVGIISHVETVKARVPVRLIVSPSQMGICGSRVQMEYC